MTSSQHPPGTPLAIPPEWLDVHPDLARFVPSGSIVMRGEDWGASVHRFRLRLLDRKKTALDHVRAAAVSLCVPIDANAISTGALRFEHAGWTVEAQPWGVYVHIFVTTRRPTAPADGARALAQTFREFRPFIDFADENECAFTQAARFDFASGHVFGHMCFERVGLEDLIASSLPSFLARRGFLRDGIGNEWTLGERGRVCVTTVGEDELRVEIPGLAEFERFAEEALRGA